MCPLQPPRSTRLLDATFDNFQTCIHFAKPSMRCCPVSASMRYRDTSSQREPGFGTCTRRIHGLAISLLLKKDVAPMDRDLNVGKERQTLLDADAVCLLDKLL